MDIFLLHLLLLAWTGFGVVRHRITVFSDRFLASLILGWLNLTCTGLLLSALHRLGDPAWFFGTSAALAGFLLFAFRSHPAVNETDYSRVPPVSEWTWSVTVLISGTGLLLLAGIQAVTAAVYEPIAPEAVAHQLPRVLLAIGEGRLGLPGAGLPEGWFPYAHDLLLSMGCIYRTPAQVLNQLNLLTWIGAIVACHRLMRLLGGTAGAGLTIALIAASTSVSLGETSTTSPTGAIALGVAAALVFTLRARDTGTHSSDIVLASLAAGLAAGCSLPGMLVAGLAIGAMLLAAGLRIRRQMAGPAVLVLVLGLPGWWLGGLPRLGQSLCAWAQPIDLPVLGTGVFLAGMLTVVTLRPPRGPISTTARSFAAGGLAILGFSALFPGSSRETMSALLPLGAFSLAIIRCQPPLPLPQRALALGALVLAGIASWGASHAILHESRRPLGPLLPHDRAAPCLPPLPPELQKYLAAPDSIRLEIEGEDPLLYAVMVRAPFARFVSRPQGGVTGRLLRSRTARDEARKSPDYLGTLQVGGVARDYFGRPFSPQNQPSTPSLRKLDLIGCPDAPVPLVTGLLSTEGPFPLFDLPFVRFAAGPVVRLILPALPEGSSRRLHFSVRLLGRSRSILRVQADGRPLGRYLLLGHRWTEQTLELPAGPVEVLLANEPLRHEPDWMEYLERYHDVRHYLLAHNLPLEEGAHEHYELSGRAEGRTVTYLPDSLRESASCTLIFRQLQLEPAS